MKKSLFAKRLLGYMKIFSQPKNLWYAERHKELFASDGVKWWAYLLAREDARVRREVAQERAEKEVQS